MRLTVRVKVVGELTVNARVPFEDTGRDRPVLLSVIEAVSALVEAQDRLTELPGITQ